jgi:hypothetical protein
LSREERGELEIERGKRRFRVWLGGFADKTAVGVEEAQELLDARLRAVRKRGGHPGWALQNDPEIRVDGEAGRDAAAFGGKVVAGGVGMEPDGYSAR